MEVGVEVWVKDLSIGDWIPSVVLAKTPLGEDGKTYEITMSFRDRELKAVVKDGAQEDVENVKLRNHHEEKDVDNLINLPYLHEPAILYCLEQRYQKSDIYTYTGPILIAVNPFKKVHLYTTQVLETYYNQGLLASQGIESPTQLAPHIYAVADAAFRAMMTTITEGGRAGSSNRRGSAAGLGAGASSKGGGAGDKAGINANQAILISGESGAGKTESTKIVLRYLTTVGNSSGSMDVSEGSVMDKVLQSNPILEAFGNAKTIRNDNSSRFGKYIELNFSKRGHLVGGTIRTYLLEKVRLPSQQPGERNFHVFYQMHAGASDEEKAFWNLGPAESLHYANQGGVYRLQNFDDKEEYAALRKALKVLNFQAESITSLFNAMAGIQHLGQIGFNVDKDGEGSIPKPDALTQQAIENACKLLGINAQTLIQTLTTRLLVTRDESLIKKIDVRSAVATRDALAKAIYGRIFNWIVTTINYSIHVDDSNVRADIGVLDIFGFECFKYNSFEQLCINYTNETLQQQFNQYVFKLEQIEYNKEKIEWSFISFPDNQDCLDLIEHKTQGILAFLDDECRLPKATDEKLASRLYKSLEGHSRFTCTPKQKRDLQFCISHYAGPVVYNVESFVEKNKDELPKEAVTLMQESSVTLLSAVFIVDITEDTKSVPTGAASAGPQKRQSMIKDNVVRSVGSQFKTQLVSLMEKITSTKPHYIRCLKPNDQNIPDNFNRVRTTEQLRYGGVLEAVRVARSGFPVRLTHSEFFTRYRSLANPGNPATKSLPLRTPGAGATEIASSSDNEAAKNLAVTLLNILWDGSEAPASASGSASVSVTATVALSSRKAEALSLWTGPHNVAKQSVQLGLTKTFMRSDAHDLLEGRRSRRYLAAARTMQAFIRAGKLRRVFLHKIYSLRLLQRLARGALARSRVRKMRQRTAAIIIQTSVRMHLARYHYACLLYSIVVLQSTQRKILAKRIYAEKLYLFRVVRLQKYARGLIHKSNFTKYRRAALSIQCKQRQRTAKGKLSALKAEAKDLGAMKQSNADLKREIEMLKEQAEKLSEEKARKAEREAEERARTEAAKQREEERRKFEEAQAKNNIEREKEAKLLESVRAELAQAKEDMIRSAALAKAAELSVLKTPQAETDALYAEIAMLKDLLNSEREAKLHIEDDLQEALILLSAERKEKLELETHVERLTVIQGQGLSLGEFSGGHSLASSGKSNSSRSRSSTQNTTQRTNSNDGSTAAAAAALAEASTLSPIPSENDTSTDNKDLSPMALDPTWQQELSPSPSQEDAGIAAAAPKSVQVRTNSSATNPSVTSIAGIFRVIGDDDAGSSTVSGVVVTDTSAGAGVGAAASSSIKTRTTSTISRERAASVPTVHEDDEEEETETRGSAATNDEDADEVGDVHAQLQNEKTIRACLEDEVSRLRKISVELSEQLQRAGIGPGGEDAYVVSGSIGADPAAASASPRQRTKSTGGAGEGRRYSNPRLSFGGGSPSSRNLSNSEFGDDSMDKTVEEDRTSSSYMTQADTTANSVSGRRPSVGGGGLLTPRRPSVSDIRETGVTPQSEQNDAIKKFYRSLDAFHTSMMEGKTVYVWEGSDLAHKVEVRMRLEDDFRSFSFIECKSPARRTSLIPTRVAAWFTKAVNVSPIKVEDIFECLPGTDTNNLDRMGGALDGETADSSLLTLVSRTDGSHPRTLLILLSSREERNNFISGLRMMQSAGSTVKALREAQSPKPAPMKGTPHVQVQVHVQSPAPPLSTTGAANAYQSPMQVQNTGATPLSSVKPFATSASASASAPTAAAAENKAPQGRARALSKREEILANRRPSISAGAATPKAGNMPEISVPAPAPNPAAPAFSTSAGSAYPPPPGTPGPAVDLGSYERVLSKNLTLTNELNDRDTEIIALKKREAVYEQTLKAKEKMYEQDANVRMQLGRRLEQILLDKEEAKDEIDDLRMHIGKLEGMLLDFSRERAEREATAALQVQQQVLKASAERSPSKF